MEFRKWHFRPTTKKRPRPQAADWKSALFLGSLLLLGGKVGSCRGGITAGVALPHSSSAQYGSGPHIAASALQPGDLVFYYSPISHVGMYIGNGMIVHAANPSTDRLILKDPTGGASSGVRFGPPQTPLAVLLLVGALLGLIAGPILLLVSGLALVGVRLTIAAADRPRIWIALQRRGRRAVRWLPPETFTGKLPLDHDAVLVPRIARRLTGIRLPAGRLPVNHGLVVVSGHPVDSILAMLDDPEVQAQANDLSLGIDGGYRSFTATLLRQLIIPRRHLPA